MKETSYLYIDEKNLVVYADDKDSYENSLINRFKRFVMPTANVLTFMRYYNLRFHKLTLLNSNKPESAQARAWRLKKEALNANYFLSEQGFDFNGKKLTEDTRFTDLIVWRSGLYEYGNRYKNLIELYKDGKFYRNEYMENITLAKKK